MYDRLSVLQLIEDAEKASPFCACGGTMVAVDRDGALWLECPERDRRTERGFFARVLSGNWLWPHWRQLILNWDDRAA